MIDVRDGDRIRTITLDRPAARNALTVSALEGLADAITDASTPVIVIDGAKSSFCAGADLETVAGLDDRGARDFARLGQRVTRTIEDSPSVVVASIDGPARGGGVEIALACDLRVGTPEATLGQPGITFGLFGAWGGTVRLPRIVGDGTALDFSLSGRVVDADEALRMGLLSRIEPDPHAVARTIADYPQDTLEILSERIRDDRTRAVQERAEVAAFSRLVDTHADDVTDLLGSGTE